MSNEARSAAHKRTLLVLGSLGLGGCTALGPTPATTGMSAVPAGRPGLEVSAGVLPGHYLSAGVQETPKSAAISSAALLIEPDSVLQVPGLVVGGRYVGSASAGGFPEPMIGYRTFLGSDHLVAISAIGYGAHASGEEKGASFSATRGGAEAAVDVRLTPEFHWFELHLQTALSLTGMTATGTYCVDSARTYAIDCPDSGTREMTTSNAGGLYPSAVMGLGFDIGRHLNGAFHGGRIAIMGGGGTMPRVVSGMQQGAHPYGSAGLSLTVGFGEGR